MRFIIVDNQNKNVLFCSKRKISTNKQHKVIRKQNENKKKKKNN